MNKSTKKETFESKVLSFIPNGEYYFSKAVKAFQNNNLQLAKKYLERANQLEPNEPMIICQLAIVLAELGQYESANERLYYILNQIDPTMVECYYFLANNYAFLGLYKEALYNARNYIILDPNGEFVEDAKELVEVLSLEYDEVENIFEKDDDFLNEYFFEDELIEMQESAKNLLKNGQLKDAIKLLKRVIEKYPTFWPAYNNLALAFYYTGKTGEAIGLLKKVLQENPGNLHALCNLAILSFNQGEQMDAWKSMLEKVHPISIDHRYKLGVTFAMIGNHLLAYKWLKSIINKGSEIDSYFYYWLAYSAYYTGRIETANKAWQEFLQFHPEKESMEPWKRSGQSFFPIC